MGKNSAPSYNAPAPTPRLSGQELFSQGTDYAKANMPNAFGAREQALSDVNDPNYYAKFQPTGFEQALGNQYFQNVWPDQQKAIMNQLSRSGMADSPVAADVLGRSLGKTQFDIGSYLSNLGNQRATDSLNYRNIDPNSVISPFVQTSQTQSNANASATDQYNQAMAMAQYQDAVNKFNQQNAMQKAFGAISPIGGAIYGASTGGGAGFANSLGGSLSTASMFAPFLAGAAGGFGAAGGASGGSGMLGNYLTSGMGNMFSQGQQQQSPFALSVNPNQNALSAFGGGVRGGI